jgi:alpha/beta superfamily hydrolase
MPISHARKEELALTGPAGRLQALLEWPANAGESETDASVACIAIICHPHPQYQGTMLNKVVHTLVRAHNQLGMPALRFNFRGVGDSDGDYADGDGEGDDLLAVAGYVKQRWPNAVIWLAGFSFGAVVAARKATEIGAHRLTSVAPAVNVLEAKLAARPAMPWLIVHGSADEIVPLEAVRSWVAANQPGPELVVLPGAGHFFHGELVTLRKLLVEKLAAE